MSEHHLVSKNGKHELISFANHDKVLDFVRNVKCSKTASRNTDINFNIRNEDFLVKSKNIYISIPFDLLSFFSFSPQ